MLDPNVDCNVDRDLRQSVSLTTFLAFKTSAIDR